MKKKLIAALAAFALIFGISTVSAAPASAGENRGWITNYGSVDIRGAENYLGSGKVAGPEHVAKPGQTIGGTDAVDIDALKILAGHCYVMRFGGATADTRFDARSATVSKWIKIGGYTGAWVKKGTKGGACPSPIVPIA